MEARRVSFTRSMYPDMSHIGGIGYRLVIGVPNVLRWRANRFRRPTADPEPSTTWPPTRFMPTGHTQEEGPMYQLSHHARFDTEIEHLWHAFTQPESLASWLWPDEATEATIDLRVGGAWRAAAPNLDIAVGGRYTLTEEPNRLAFTWNWDGEAAVTQVSVEFTGIGLVLEHHGFSCAESRDSHIEGWRDCLGRLPRFLGRVRHE